MLTSHTPQVQVHGVDSPGRKGEPNFRIPRAEVFAGGAEKPDDAHAETDSEKGETDAG